MRYLLSLVLGLALGVAAAGAALYFNPLTRREAQAPDRDAQVFSYALAASDTFVATHNRALGLPVVPVDAPLLFERGVNGSVLAAMPLGAEVEGERGTDSENETETENESESGGVEAASAVATRFTVPSPQTGLLTAGVLVDDYWLVSVPGSGSMFVRATSNLWPLLRDTVAAVDWLGREWNGPRQYRPTRGPADGAAAVVGLTGRFAGTSGTASERLTLTDYDGSFAELAGELRLQMPARRAVAEASTAPGQ